MRDMDIGIVQHGLLMHTLHLVVFQAFLIFCAALHIPSKDSHYINYRDTSAILHAIFDKQVSFVSLGSDQSTFLTGTRVLKLPFRYFQHCKKLYVCDIYGDIKSVIDAA